MLIDLVIKNESERNKRMITEYENLLETLPKGSLICRKKEYYYLKYRKDGKIHDEYVGKNPEILEKVKEQLDRRKHCEEMLSELKREQKAINKILEELA